MGDRICKVCSAIRRYELIAPDHESFDEALVARWKGTDDHTERGYRPLTEWFNKYLLWTEYDRCGRETLGNRIQSDFDGLTGDDGLVCQEISADIAADGIDVDQLRSDMVSWGTMRRHLTKCLDKSKPQSINESGWEYDSLAKTCNIAAEKVGKTLSSLETKGKLAGVDAAAVEVDVQLRCQECKTIVPLDVALDQGYVCQQHSQLSAEVPR